MPYMGVLCAVARRRPRP